MESEAVPPLLSSAAFPGVGAHDDLLGVVELLRAFSNCVSIVRFRSAADLGAVSLSWNSAAHRVMADVIASSSWVFDSGVRFSRRLGSYRWCRTSVRYSNNVFYVCIANGVE